MRNTGIEWPGELITLGLSPAALPKGRSGYDLALACSVLVAAELVPPDRLAGTVLIGELVLDGRVRPVRGVLPGLLAARRSGLRRAIVPTSTLAEAALVGDMEVLGADRLDDVLEWLRGVDDRLSVPGPAPDVPEPDIPDLSDVLGQSEARWALEVAAAGGHHLLLVGPPGTGKTSDDVRWARRPAMLSSAVTGFVPAKENDVDRP